jgi:hypothetical protein
MAILQSNADALLVAIPMIGLLIAIFFRLDEIVVKPRKQGGTRNKLSSWDKDGRPVCADPDEKLQGEIKKSSRVVS